MQSEITERAKTAWNSIADEFNQWDALGLDEQETYVALTAALSEQQAVETFTRGQMLAEVERRVERALAARSALVDVPAVEPAIPTANCCVCGRIIDTREKSEGGDDFGDETEAGKWTCSVQCYDAYVGFVPDEVPPLSEGEDSAEVERLRGLLDVALDALDSYADPTGYTDSDGEQVPSDADVHQGLLAKETAANLRTALAATRSGSATTQTGTVPASRNALDKERG